MRMRKSGCELGYTDNASGHRERHYFDASTTFI